MARVLIVDDAPEVRNLLATIVRREGHEAVTASDAADAWLQLSGAGAPAMIFADIDMPGETGAQFVMRLRTKAQFEQLPVVFVTAFRERAAAVATADPAVVDVIDKPFRLDAIAQTLRSVLGAP